MASNTTVKLAFSTFEPAEGASEKTPVIFMHGMTTSKENWQGIPQTVANATKRKVYALDARNHGNSPWHDWPDFDCNVDDLLHFMDSMTIPRATLVGHSMGGFVAIKTALKKPERVEKLIVEDMFVKRIPQELCAGVIAYLNLANASLQQVAHGTDDETAKKFLLDYVYKNMPKEQASKLTKRDWRDIDLKLTVDGRYSFRFNSEGVVNVLKNMAESFKENKGIYEGPASFMYGGLSPYKVGEEKEHILKFFPNAEFLKFEKATHTVHANCPIEFTEALIKVLLEK